MENSINERVWELISRKLSGEATEVELLELHSLLQQQPADAYSLEILHDLWNATAPEKENNQYAEFQYKELTQKMQKMGINTNGFRVEDEHLITAQNDILPGKKFWHSSRRMLVAPFFVFVIAVFPLVLMYHSKTTEPSVITKSSEITTKDGSKTSIILPDGTKVWVNAGSKLTYDNTYGNKLREVTLLGEAFFDVTKNPEKPFIIHTADMDIKVLGTAFNVRCYPNEKKTETSLIRGRIEVTLRERPNERIYLNPNEKLTLLNGNIIPSESVTNKKVKQVNEIVTGPLLTIGHVTLQPTDKTIVETSWVENRLEFGNEAFEEVASKMEKWYGVKIHFEDEHLKQEHLTGTFENETIEQALTDLQYTTPFKFSINKTNITITK